jgi:serine/threonine protein kinase
VARHDSISAKRVLLAPLNHPNIVAVYELEESEGVHFLVLELVPGETLAARIERGPISIDDVLPLNLIFD